MANRKRTRDAPDRYEEAGPSKVGRGEFSGLENTHLYGALLKEGPLNTAKLAQAVGTRTEYQVKHRISALQLKAQQSLNFLTRKYKNGAVRYEPREKVAIDRWLDHLQYLNEKAEIVNGTQEELPVRMMALSMGLITQYEEHPKPEECGGVDMKNVYRFLEHMMLGVPSRTLGNADSKFLIDALHRLSRVVESPDTGREKSFVCCGRPQWRVKGVQPKTYGMNRERPQILEETDQTLNLLNSEKYNPFQVPTQWLKKDIELPDY